MVWCHNTHYKVLKFYNPFHIMFTGVSTNSLRQSQTGLAHAFRQGGHPIVEYDVERLSKTRPEFQNHVLWHECAHHALGHFDNYVSDVARRFIVMKMS